MMTDMATLRREWLLLYTERLALGKRLMVEDSCFRRARTIIVLALLAMSAGCGSGSHEEPSAAGPGESSSTATQEPGTALPAGGRRAVDSESLPYAEVDDQLVYGHFAFPSDMIEPLPAIVIVHDWWGLNDHVLAEADRVAAEGYIVLAVDLYGGDVVDTPEAARAKMISVLENPDLVESNLRQALEFVGVAGAPQVAMLGWGLGGGWSLDAARLFPAHVDATVVYYGRVSDDEDRLADIDSPVLGLFGERDRGIKVETVRRFEAAMHRLRKDLTLQIYEDIGHGFADPARANYRADIAAAAWQQTMDFLAANLSSAPDES